MLYRRWWASSAGWKIKDSDHDCCLTWGLQLRVLRSSNFKLRFLCLCFGDGLRLDSWGRASRLPSDLDPASDWARTEFRYAEFARSQEGTPKPHQQRMIWVAPSFTRVSHKHLFPPHELYFHPHSHLLHQRHLHTQDFVSILQLFNLLSKQLLSQCLAVRSYPASRHSSTITFIQLTYQ